VFLCVCVCVFVCVHMYATVQNNEKVYTN
jgi:hypothetical protein